MNSSKSGAAAAAAAAGTRAGKKKGHAHGGATSGAIRTSENASASPLTFAAGAAELTAADFPTPMIIDFELGQANGPVFRAEEEVLLTSIGGSATAGGALTGGIRP